MANVTALKSAPRFFTPSQSLKEQISVLDSLIKQPSAGAYLHTITPQLAKHILDKLNGINRPQRPAKILEYMDAMNDNRWPVTGATIVFSKNGMLMDGQHRLQACVQTGRTFQTYAVFGVDASAFAMIDTGRKRSNVDAFAIQKIPNPAVAAKAVRWLWIFDNDPLDRSVTLTNDELLDWHSKHVDAKLLNACVTTAIKIEKETRATSIKKGLPSGATACLLYLFSQINQRAADEFAKDLVGGGRFCKAICNEMALVMQRSGGRIAEVYRNAIIINAWNLFRAGSKSARGKVSWDGAKQPFPVAR